MAASVYESQLNGQLRIITDYQEGRNEVTKELAMQAFKVVEKILNNPNAIHNLDIESLRKTKNMNLIVYVSKEFKDEFKNIPKYIKVYYVKDVLKAYLKK